MRLLVPGYEGNMNVKWLRRIKVVDAPIMAQNETMAYTISFIPSFFEIKESARREFLSKRIGGAFFEA
jgi:DMSO/TMAO reductase YedYZ molybdopterin-dependent catalytic subunit